MAVMLVFVMVLVMMNILSAVVIRHHSIVPVAFAKSPSKRVQHRHMLRLQAHQLCDCRAHVPVGHSVHLLFPLSLNRYFLCSIRIEFRGGGLRHTDQLIRENSSPCTLMLSFPDPIPGKFNRVPGIRYGTVALPVRNCRS